MRGWSPSASASPTRWLTIPMRGNEEGTGATGEALAQAYNPHEG